MNKKHQMIIKAITIGILVLVASAHAKSTPPAPTGTPDWAEFRYFCQIHRSDAQSVTVERPPIGEVSFIPVRALQNQQTDFSFVRLMQQMQKALKHKDAEYSKKRGQWILPHDGGRSLFDKETDLVGIFYRGRVYLADGHHKALASIYIGAETAPVAIIDDWSKKPPREFAQAMADAGYSHWINVRGQSVSPVDFCSMVDNPNLMLARMLIRRIVAEGYGKKLIISVGSGSQMPIALKINHDIPFLEREIADALSRAGVLFDDTRTDEDIGKKERREYLDILRKVARRHPRLGKVLLLAKPSKVESLDLEAILREHLALPGCEDKLLARSR